MESFHEYIDEYRKQMKKGVISKAYKGLMEYILYLKTYFQNKYPDHFVSGSIYFGYMDMTYFSFYPKSLGDKKLKIAVVFLHESMRFEVWLAGANKQVQSKYWKLFKESNWNTYHLVPTTKGADSILEHIVADNPDFHDLDTLTKHIEKETVKFIKDVENFLSK
ncbi:MAG: hypothetical protein IPP66_04485 [Anaerolineales bacterium]|nr:hypothetical protein [Anaerolineales bacterium]